MSDDHPISRYYEEKAKRARALWCQLQQSKKDGADAATIKQLEHAYELAAYTGD